MNSSVLITQVLSWMNLRRIGVNTLLRRKLYKVYCNLTLIDENFEYIQVLQFCCCLSCGKLYIFCLYHGMNYDILMLFQVICAYVEDKYE